MAKKKTKDLLTTAVRRSVVTTATHKDMLAPEVQKINEAARIRAEDTGDVYAPDIGKMSPYQVKQSKPQVTVVGHGAQVGTRMGSFAEAAKAKEIPVDKLEMLGCNTGRFGQDVADQTGIETTGVNGNLSIPGFTVEGRPVEQRQETFKPRK